MHSSYSECVRSEKTGKFDAGSNSRRRAVADVVQTIFGVSLALGTACRRKQEAAAALADAHREALAAVRAAPAKQADKAGWKQAGRTCWLWATATPRVCIFSAASLY